LEFERAFGGAKENEMRGFKKLFASLAIAALLGTSGCASNNGYYNSGTPAGYYYSDPHVCSTEKGLCPLLIGGAIVGAAALLAGGH
jgi:hypothetical protein